MIYKEAEALALNGEAFILEKTELPFINYSFIK